MMRWLLAAYRDPRTYTGLAYMLAVLPLGIAGFTVTVTGLAAGAGLMVTLAGVPILVGTLLFARTFARLNRRLAWTLLDAPVSQITPIRDEGSGYFWGRLRSLIGARDTTGEVCFSLLSLPLAIVAFVVAVTILWSAVAGFALPVVTALGGATELGTWRIDTPAESLIFLPISVLFLAVGPRLLLGWGGLIGRVVASLVGRVNFTELKSGVVSILARRGEADGFTILGDLRLRFGRSPSLTPLEVKAALLVLESNRVVIPTRREASTSYRLA